MSKRTKNGWGSECRVPREGMGEARVGTMPGSGIPLPHPPFGMSDGEVPTEFVDGEWCWPTDAAATVSK